MAGRVREGKVKPEDGDGSTFSNETWGNVIDLYHYEDSLGNTWEWNTCESKDGAEIPECTPPTATPTIN